jgi:hypothetical protein
MLNQVFIVLVLKQEVKTKEVSEWLSEWYSDTEINVININNCRLRGIYVFARLY